MKKCSCVFLIPKLSGSSQCRRGFDVFKTGGRHEEGNIGYIWAKNLPCMIELTLRKNITFFWRDCYGSVPKIIKKKKTRGFNYWMGLEKVANPISGITCLWGLKQKLSFSVALDTLILKIVFLGLKPTGGVDPITSDQVFGKWYTKASPNGRKPPFL